MDRKRQNGRRRGGRPLALVAALSGLACAAAPVSLSGTVTDPWTGAGIPGVSVALAGVGLPAAVSGADGSWRLEGTPTGLARGGAARHPVGCGLRLEAGRIRVDRDGWSPAGRSIGPVGREPGPSAAAARGMDDAVDTLVYSLAGAAVLRDTILSRVRAGIVRRIDADVNPEIVHGYFADPRDGRVYRTVRIGNLEWFAENLAYQAPDGWSWPLDDADSGKKYGRLYTWTAALGLAPSCTASTCAIDPVLRGICPVGWHVSSDSEWFDLAAAIGARRGLEDSLRFDSLDGHELQSRSGWRVNQGSDLHGFRALPAGAWLLGTEAVPARTYQSNGVAAYFWTTGQYDPHCAFRRAVFNEARARLIRYWGGGSKNDRYSVRCVGDPGR